MKSHEEFTTALTQLAREIYEANKAKGFWPEHPAERNFGEVLMLVVSELGEALEAHRKGRFADRLQLLFSLSTEDKSVATEVFVERVKDSIEDEIADAVIRLLDLCGGYNINIGAHVEAKLRYNQTRGHKHGKSY